MTLILFDEVNRPLSRAVRYILCIVIVIVPHRIICGCADRLTFASKKTQGFLAPSTSYPKLLSAR